MMLAKFRDRYPQGSLVSKLIKIDRGNFIVKVSITVENITLVTALAGASSVESAEDAARTRAISALCLDQKNTSLVSTPTFAKHIALVEPQQSQVEASVASEQKELLANHNVVRIAESEISTSSPANLASGNASLRTSNTSSRAPFSEPTIVSAQSVQGSSNLFEGTFPPSSNPSPLEDHKKTSKEIDKETNAINFEFTDKPISEPMTDNHPMKATEVLADFDFTQVKQKTDIEIARLGWTRDDGREFLQSRYGKRSRLHLKNEELQEFLSYLEQLPTPVN